ncbi:hypothetical protein SAMN05443247_06216 [Bradyrhizobium erythrophlei]|jgi:hypothetical protein|nr:hypothetical protein SAMN05443247_06216 [Bradyrhizobium erythrophlei]
MEGEDPELSPLDLAIAQTATSSSAASIRSVLRMPRTGISFGYLFQMIVSDFRSRGACALGRMTGFIAWLKTRLLPLISRLVIVSVRSSRCVV